MKKLFQLTLAIAIISVIANIGLLIMWQSGKKYYQNLEKQVDERDELIRKFYADHLVLDKNGMDLLKSICLNDSVSSITGKTSKIEDSERRIIYNIVMNYKRKIENRDIQGYTDLFADSVSRFFLLDSVSNKYIYENIKKNWSSQSNPDEPIYDLGSISIDRRPEEFIVYIPFKLNSDEYITELRINNEFKIFYIRDFLSYVNNKK